MKNIRSRLENLGVLALVVLALVAVIWTPLAFAQPETPPPPAPTGTFLDAFAGLFSSGFVAWFAVVVAVGSLAVFLSRRGVALILERKWKFSKWLAVGDRAIGVAAVISLAVALFVFQDGVLERAQSLAFLPAWQTVVFVVLYGVIGSSGGVDAENRAARKSDSSDGGGDS